MRRTWVLAPILACALLLPGRPAGARTLFGVELNSGIPTGDVDADLASGIGVALRAGYRVPLPALLFAPEVKGEYFHFPADGTVTSPPRDNFGLLAGARVGLPLLLSPSAYLHVGYGWVHGTSGKLRLAGDGFLLDTGLVLELPAVLPMLNIGLQAGYERIQFRDRPLVGQPDSQQWFKGGVHVELVY